MKATQVMLVGLVCLFVIGCTLESDADRKQREETEKRMGEAYSKVGMPDILNWNELRNAKMIMELRDKELVTYTYVKNLDGSLTFLGESIGYGLPYSVQMTNPMRRLDGNATGELTTIPQAEPNGLFMPEGLSATWIMLRNPGTGEVSPVYVEPEIIVSPFPLKHDHSYVDNG